MTSLRRRRLRRTCAIAAALGLAAVLGATSTHHHPRGDIRVLPNWERPLSALGPAALDDR